MATTKKQSARNKQRSPYQGNGPVEDLAPAQRIAHDILVERADVLPSVDRIMNAGLSDAVAERALTLFRTALLASGDPHRDPRVAIAAASANG
jgi:hypothetical protein